MCRIAPYKGGWRARFNARIHAIEAMLLPVPSPDYFGTGLDGSRFARPERQRRSGAAGGFASPPSNAGAKAGKRSRYAGSVAPPGLSSIDPMQPTPVRQSLPPRPMDLRGEARRLADAGLQARAPGAPREPA